MALKQIKNKIIATKKTGQVTKAMESVSAVKMRKSQERAFAGRPYVHAAMRILSQLAGSTDGLDHPLAKSRGGDKRLLVIVTSDKGLAGSVNSAVLKLVEQTLSTADVSEYEAICIGRKSVEFAQRNNIPVVHEYTNVADDVSVDDVADITTEALQGFAAGEYNHVHVVYQNFLSTFEQEPTKRQILPLDPAEIHYIMQGIKPKSGQFSGFGVAPATKTAYQVEPSAEAVLDTLIPQLVQIIIYHALLESKASEHSARMVAMKNATDKSKEVAKALTLVFNKERQAAITAEVSEITGGIEAMK
ncbi:ATP synthase F1 subunit gamma [bacterium]|nr:ATP synthase F1 subunit gamma [bacterium]